MHIQATQCRLAAPGMETSRLFLIADDLTGALDSAAQFARPGKPVEVRWRAPASFAGARLAIDSATRELTSQQARSAVAALVAALPQDANALYYAKLDSLLRGHAGAEIAAWTFGLRPERCLIAPAFPFQNRVTRDGRQYFLHGGAWTPTQTDLRDDLQRQGLTVQLCRPGDAAPLGISLWDAACDADLAAVVAAGRAAGGPVLWCGSGGLAGALSATPQSAAAAVTALAGPVLGLFGTDHPVTMAQLDACGDLALQIAAGDAVGAGRVRSRLRAAGVALVRLDLPDGLSRGEAAERIGRHMHDLVRSLDPPGTLVVAGGETLRGLCLALEAEHLDLDGQLLPGVPSSTLRGGRFHGVRVISKSGAFGESDFLRRLVAPAQVPTQSPA
ncbi:MAG: four-carbon acid sugar kinase family protein [Azospirillaceae bacterium]|nr:four-carbon acid sugar kinase family protein [Azospirillaceae bacterium]